MGGPGTLPPSTLLEVQFKQYKLFVETAEVNSTQRATTQRYYTTVHTSLLTLLAIVGGYGLLTTGSGSSLAATGNGYLAQIQAPVVFVLCTLGVALSVLWRTHIIAYRRLNSAKFKIINAMEEVLPFRPFNDEWSVLTGKGMAKRKRHVRLSTLEGIVPFIAITFYFALGLIYFAITSHWQIPILKTVRL